MSGGIRFNEGKAPLSYILEAKHALQGVAKVFEFGAEKYARSNWRKGLSHTKTLDSMLRHIAEYASGVDVDEESKLPHVDHILANAIFLAEMVRTHPELDDRGKPDGESN